MHLKLEISKRQLMESLESDSPPFVLDIRQPEELHDDSKMPAAILIPMSQRMARLNEVPKDKPLVIVCHSGHRSLVVQRFLSTKG